MELEPAAPVEITDLKNADLKNLAELGQGNGGSVMKVEHVPSGTVMAKKIVLIDAKPSIRKQILRELQIMHSCKSPYIISTYGAFLSEPNICICMEFMDKGSFDGICKSVGAVDMRVVRQLAYAVLEGLMYLYDVHRIIHRDIKPSNILFNSKGEIKLCDFGVSGELINSIANTFVGTSIYMSPERIQGAEYSVKSDVWSLGISLVELATGRFPFSDSCADDDDENDSDLETPDNPNTLTLGRTARRKSRPVSGVSPGEGGGAMSIIELMHQIVKEPAPRLGAEFAPEEDEFVEACLLKDPEARKTPKELLVSRSLRYPWCLAHYEEFVQAFSWMEKARQSTFDLKESWSPLPLFSVCLAAVAVSAAPNPEPFATLRNATLSARSETLITSTTGTDSGYFYSLWMQDASGATMDVNANKYSLTWSTSTVNVVGGVGWNPGSAQTITYSGSFSTSGNAYLSVYGWTTSPLVEYYIVENYGDYNPSTGASLLGTVTSDGATYNIYHTVRTNEPSIQGTATFDQFWSVRQSLRTGGTVTTANHFNAWKSHGLTLGTFNYQILATKGYESSGSSSVTVTSGGSSSSGSTTTTTTATTTTTTTSSASASSTSTASSSGTQAEWGQCGGIGRTGPTACASPYVCTYSNSYYSQCLPA
ncbi:hypothetical protein H0H92_001059 [Tricholoma furcatifolium]|nr:hypothetical protein H0H92_001059 [Tricholoma furcatifolium]